MRLLYLYTRANQLCLVMHLVLGLILATPLNREQKVIQPRKFV